VTTEDLKTKAANWIAEQSPKAVDWMTGQSFNNVLLLCILVAGGWAIHFAITDAIPKHIREIQDGYKTLQEQHIQERETIRNQFDLWLERIIDKKIGNSNTYKSGYYILKQTSYKL